MTTTRCADRSCGRSIPDICGCLALIGLVLAIYLPTVNFGFVNWDDPWYVVNNPLITNWRPANLWEIATKPAVRNYAPLTMFGYLLQHTAWGLWPGGYHLTNVILHAINAVLVYLLVKQLAGRRFVAWSTAALFAVHPVQVETVAWVSSFKGLLSGTFILGSLICWLRPSPAPLLNMGSNAPQLPGKREAFGLLFHLLGLLTKALGITVPAIVFSYDVLIGKKRTGDAVARQLIPSVLCVLVLLVTMSAQTTEVGGVRSHLEWSKARIVAMDSVILWRYAGLIVWPHDLCVLYDPPTTGIAGVILIAALGWVTVAAAAFAGRKRFPLFVVGLIAFVALLFPVLNFFPITTLMNDRYLYLPSIPLFAMMAAGLEWVAAFGKARLDRLAADRDGFDRPFAQQTKYILSRSLAWSVFGMLLLGYTVATHERLPAWRNDRALWDDAIQKSPGLAVVRIQWATALHDSQSNSEAVAALERALTDTNPDTADRQRIQNFITDWKKKPDRPL